MKKTINLRGIANPMSEKEMKNTIGGVVQLAVLGIDSGGSGGGGSWPGWCSSSCSGRCSIWSNGYPIAGTCEKYGPGPVYACTCALDYF